MEQILTGIYSVYNGAAANELKTAVSGYVPPTGMFPYHAPAGFSYPVITYTLVTSTASRLMQSIALEIPIIQFSVWDENPSPLRAVKIADKLDTLFEGKCLSLATHTQVDMTKKFEKLLALEENKWHYVLQYEILTTK